MSIAIWSDRDVTWRSTRHGMVCCFAVFSLMACGGGGKVSTPTTTGDSQGNDNLSGPSGPTSPTVPSAPITLKAQIAQLESSGALPALDRSSSLVGPDVNNNGVRDDIEAYISRLPINSVQQQAALQKAKTLQLTITVDLTDKAALQKVGDAGMASTKCLGKNFAKDSTEMSSRIEAMTANTRERAKRYMEYNAARSGSSTTWPSGETCE